MVKRVLKILAVFVSIAAICTVFYLNAEEMVSYEMGSAIQQSEVIKVEKSVTEINSVPESIPYSRYYDMYLKDGYIYVYNCENIPVYKTKTKDLFGLTPDDIKQLERNGLHYTARSELVEILNYMES